MWVLLTNLLKGVELIGAYVLFGIETAANSILDALAAASAAVLAVLPNMSDAPAYSLGSWGGWLNWFYPVGALLQGLAAAVTLWVGFLGVRWLLRLVRAM